MEPVVGMALAGGSGLRARPLSLGACGDVRSKATMPFLGVPLVEWQTLGLREQGVTDLRVIAKGRANRYQIKAVLGHGERHGVRVRYSRARWDATNTGSGAATLDAVRDWNLRGLALVFPTDSVFEFDLAGMVRSHLDSGALVTVASVERDAATVAGKYGVLAAGPRGRCLDFLEKPDLATIRTLCADPDRIATNAGMYLVDCDRLRRLSTSDSLRRLRASALDWGHDLLPWLVAEGVPVHHHRIERLGDLGTPRDYLLTAREVLAGGYPSLTKLMGPGTPDNVWVHESSLRLCDPESGLSLVDKLARGLVTIGANVRIGREVEIGAGSRLADTDLGDGVEIGAHCALRGVSCQDGVVVGAHARLTDTYLGVMTEVISDAGRPTVIDGFSALGDEVLVPAGAHLTGVTAYPQVRIPGLARIEGGARLASDADARRRALPPEVWHG